MKDHELQTLKDYAALKHANSCAIDLNVNKLLNMLEDDRISKTVRDTIFIFISHINIINEEEDCE